jgi:hypothetical protein
MHAAVLLRFAVLPVLFERCDVRIKLAVCVSFAFVLAACGGGGGSAPGSTVQPSANALPALVSTSSAPLYLTNANAHAIDILSQAGSSLGSIATNATPYTVELDADGNIYASFNPGTIAEYAAGSVGPVPPIREIAGPDSRVNLIYMHDFAVSPNGTIAALSQTVTTACPAPWELDIYSATATGNAAPIRSIAGKNTQLTQGWPAVDANGNVAPSRIIAGGNTGLNDPMDLTSTPGGNLAVLNQGNAPNDTTITEYPLDASGNVKPANTIANISAQSISFNSQGQLFTCCASQSIDVYAANVSGAATPIRTFPSGIILAYDLAAR